MGSTKANSVNKDERAAKIGRDFSLWQLIWFAVPSILTRLCQQLFRTLDDGLFVSRYVGHTALAATKIISPINGLQMGFANLISTGASIISSQKMGEGDRDEADRIFTRASLISVVVGLLFTAVMFFFGEPVCAFLGADEELMPITLRYTRIIYGNSALHMLGAVFASYFSVAGKPAMGLWSSIANGAMNIIFDILFIVIRDMGVAGAAWSTVIGEIVVAVMGFVFFMIRKHEVRFAPMNGDIIGTFVRIWKAGFSQFINSITLSVTGFVQNQTLLAYLGSDGIAANAIIADLRVILNAAFVGYATCVSPVIAYNYGSRDPVRLKKILSHNLKFWFFGTSLITVIGELSRSFMIRVFIPDAEASGIYDLTMQGLAIEFLAVTFTCGCIFIMRMFVALGAPHTAAVLTTMRTIVFRLSMLLLLPALFGTTGIWLAFPAGEMLSFILGAILVIRNRDNYGYGRSGVAYLMS